MPKKKVTGCLPQSVYKDSTKNKTIKAALRFALEQAGNYHGCFTGDCPHDTTEKCVEGLHEQFLESNDNHEA